MQFKVQLELKVSSSLEKPLSPLRRLTSYRALGTFFLWFINQYQLFS